MGATAAVPEAPKGGLPQAEPHGLYPRAPSSQGRFEFGNDFPVALPDVAHGLNATVTRQDVDGSPCGSAPGQRLALPEAIAAFSAGAAYALLCQGLLGRPAPTTGYQADLTCFRDDLRVLSSADLRKAPAAATLVAGAPAHRALRSILYLGYNTHRFLLPVRQGYVNMKAHVRAAAATITLSHSLKSTVSSVFDHSKSEHVLIQVAISNDQVNAYDHENECHISGKMPSLYHHGEGSHLQINKSGDRYSGYDHGSGSHFSIKISNRQAQVYDHGDGKHFIFST